MSARRLIAVRVAESGLAEVDALAAKRGITRSDMIRTLLGMALAMLRQEQR